MNEGCEKQVAQVIRKQSIACILVSKWLIHEPEALGAKAFLFKPISIQKLHDILESLINQVTQSSTANQELDQLRSQLRLARPDILIAEDNPVNRMLLNSLLGEHSNIETVDNGEEAVKSCQGKRYNVILLDLQMPKLNGLDAAHLIRHKSMLNRQTPIIVISANSTELHSEKLKKAGVDLCLQKPIDENQLLNHLLRIIKKQNLPR